MKINIVSWTRRWVRHLVRPVKLFTSLDGPFRNPTVHKEYGPWG